jgi:hypothetical protein
MPTGLKEKITPIRIFILEVLAGEEEKVIVFQSMVVLAEEEEILVFQPMVVLEQRVELSLFYYYRGDCDDVYILSLLLYVYHFYDVVFVQIKKHRRIITLKRL